MSDETPAASQILADKHQELPYDSLLLVSFGGPEGPDDVIPFLENVLRGKNVPRERMLEVAEHYQKFGGVSPINRQNLELLEAIKAELSSHGIDLPVYWGNRNWKPLFADTLQQMKDDGCKRSLAFFTSMFSCYSGCRQYRENIIEAREAVGPDAPLVEKVRMGFNHPSFIDAICDGVKHSLAELGVGADQAKVLYTAHSIPNSMSDNCDYVKQLTDTAGLISSQLGVTDWELVYQSRSGPPQQPWLEPDICDRIETLDEASKLSHVVIVPIGFISDHMEVLYDLDDEAATLCKERGIQMSRAATVGVHPSFVGMIRELVQERIGQLDQRRAIGDLGPWHDVCPVDCCTYTPRRPPPRT
ncbi:MAG: ferrochelatase [Rhodopirellula sp. TMED11]|nr:MAG: ferrochelatase [Rhodopirellula sp. TMED11]